MNKALTKKAFREDMNKRYYEEPSFRGGSFVQAQSLGYGDLLYNMDRTRFNFEYKEWKREQLASESNI